MRRSAPADHDEPVTEQKVLAEMAHVAKDLKEINLRLQVLDGRIRAFFKKQQIDAKGSNPPADRIYTSDCKITPADLELAASDAPCEPRIEGGDAA